MALKFFNTLTRKKEAFKPIKKGQVKIYSCGPTVYNKVHVGNLRAFVFYDLLRRYLEYKKYKVTQVMNITDIDDKTIKGSQKEGISLKDFTKRYEDLFFQDLDALGVEKFEFYPRATEHIREMIDLVDDLMKMGYAYQSYDGIYFSISKFKKYGKLANLDLKKLKTGASGRVKEDEYLKENPQDFALWKFWKEEDGDIFWETKLGKGRPGWHIECSAMSKKYLGETFDIHTGGIDLIFPHHTNEIAQSEAVSGKKFVNYWLHNEHLLVDGQKMSKSLGNFYTLADLNQKGFDNLSIRYLLLSSNYRQKLNLTFEKLKQAGDEIKKINDFVSLYQGKEDNFEVEELIKKQEKKFEKAMDDDLDTSVALDSIFEFIKNANKLGAGQKAVDFIKKVDFIFGFLKSQDIPQEVTLIADFRQEARKNKDWKKSDLLREEIKKKGFEIRDTSDGYVLSKI